MRSVGTSSVHKAEKKVLSTPIFVLDRDPLRLESTIETLSSFPIEAFRTASAMLIRALSVTPVSLIVDLEYSLECGMISSGFLRRLANDGVIVILITSDELALKEDSEGHKVSEYVIHRNDTDLIPALLNRAYQRLMTNQTTACQPPVG